MSEQYQLNFHHNKESYIINNLDLLFLIYKINKFIITAINIKDIPKLNAKDSSPLDVSSTILVVITLVKLSILPPTIITAPTSESALLSPVMIIINKSYLDSKIIVLRILFLLVFKEFKYSLKRLYLSFRLFNDSEIMFALATRVQWSRDSFIIDGLSGSLLDPSTPAGARTLSKIGVDASLPLSTLPNIPPPVPPQSRVPDENMERAFKFVAEYDNFHWPKS